MTTALWLALFLTLLQVWDGWTTYKVLRYPSGYEKNKLIRALASANTALTLKVSGYIVTNG